MRVLGRVLTNESFEVMEIGEELHEMQGFVEELIEAVRISSEFRDKGIVAVVNEEGFCNHLEPTLILVIDEQIGGVLVGQMFFCGVDGEDFTDLTNEQIDFIKSRIVIKGAMRKDGIAIDTLLV